MILSNIIRAFQQKKERKWKKLYWCIDLHGTIIPTQYHSETGYIPSKMEFYPYAKEVLKLLSNRDDMVLILWSSSYEDDLIEIFSWMYVEHGITWDYFNQNPEVKNMDHAQFDDGKFYFNILVDDKAGFNPEQDWWNILHTLETLELS